MENWEALAFLGLSLWLLGIVVWADRRDRKSDEWLDAHFRGVTREMDGLPGPSDKMVGCAADTPCEPVKVYAGDTA